MKTKIKALGIMNGTSLDGVDYALIETDSQLSNIKFAGHQQFSLPPDIKKQLLLAATNRLSTYELSELHFALGRVYGKQVKQLRRKWSWDIVGLHGQTVHHNGGQASLQIGHPGFIHSEFPAPVYYDFRAADVVAGGQGAPFAPFFQKALIGNSAKTPVAFHNLGGISNLTYIFKDKVIAFDTGPANILLDAWAQKAAKANFDRDGKLAAKGLPKPVVVNRFLTHTYFKKNYPKSTGREDFNLDYIEKFGGAGFKKLDLHDQMATLTELTALSIAQAYQLLTPQPTRIYFYGGGAMNPYLMKRIGFYLHETEITRTDALGIPSQGFEAATFAFFACARHFKKMVHLPKVTGAKKPQHLGSVYS